MIANPATVSLTVSEPSKTGVCSVTLSVPGGASITDRFNIVSEKARSRFIDTACSRFPGLPKTDVQQLLNDEAARITAAVTTQEPPTKLCLFCYAARSHA